MPPAAIHEYVNVLEPTSTPFIPYGAIWERTFEQGVVEIKNMDILDVFYWRESTIIATTPSFQTVECIADSLFVRHFEMNVTSLAGPVSLPGTGSRGA